MKAIRHKGNQLVFKTNMEDTNSLVTFEFQGDSIRGRIAVKGDDFPYLLKGGKLKK